MTTRRKLLIAAGASLLLPIAPPLAQQKGRIWRIGYLSAYTRPHSVQADVSGAFLQGMRDLGYVEGSNFEVEWRFAEGQYERLAALAAELVKARVDVIVAVPSPAIRAAQRATTVIPIVMASTGDPVGAGFVVSLAHPGGNITGLSNIGGEITAKHLELLVAAQPKLARVAVLGNPGSTTHLTILKNVQASARKTNIQVVSVEARTPQEIERGFLSMRQERVDAVIVASDAVFINQSKQIADLAAKLRLPSIFGISEYAPAGGLMSYSPNRFENHYRTAAYIDKILKGAKPGDLPIEQPTKFELIVNMKTAKALGLTIPQSILVRADRVIE